MSEYYNELKNPRVIIIQKIYSNFYNNEKIFKFPKHRYKKFIKDVVLGTIERNDIINEEIKNHLTKDLNLKKIDKVFEIIIKSAIYEILYKPNTPTKIIIKEYLTASNFFIENSQTKYLNALLDKVSKKIRKQWMKIILFRNISKN